MTVAEGDEGEGFGGLSPDLNPAMAGLGDSDFAAGEPSVGFGIELPNADEASPADAVQPADNTDIIMGLPVMMKVVLGTAKMPVSSLAKLARGSVVKLDKMVGDPVDILVNGRLIARGEVVVLNEGTSQFGIVLTQVGGLAPQPK